MNIQNVISNMLKENVIKNDNRCPWDNKFVRADKISKWREGVAHVVTEDVCPNQMCGVCKDLDSNKFIRLTKEERKLYNMD